MKPLILGLALSLGASIALVGCNKGESAVGTVPPPAKVEKFPEGAKVMDMFPTTVGTQSTFKPVQGDGELVLRVKDVQDQGASKIVTIEVVNQGKVNDTIKWELSEKGIMQLSARNGKVYNPPQLALAPDFKDTKEHPYTGTGPFPSVETGAPDSGELKGALLNRGIETVDTGMGQIEALAVASVYGYKSGKHEYRIANITWFAPKYGIVRMVQETQRNDGQSNSLTLKLVGFRSK